MPPAPEIPIQPTATTSIKWQGLACIFYLLRTVLAPRMSFAKVAIVREAAAHGAVSSAMETVIRGGL